MAIMEYINDLKPDANLLPKDPKSRAKVLKKISFSFTGAY
jgi:glutathione S-transferase